jgi:hypothetical protein
MEIAIAGGAYETFCLCSIRNDGVIMHSSLDMTWREPDSFGSFFDGPGEYVFTVLLSGIGSPALEAQFVLNWTGTKERSSVRPMLRLPSPQRNPSA